MDTKSELHSILLEIKARLDAGTLRMIGICLLVENLADERGLPLWAYTPLEVLLQSLLDFQRFPVREDPHTPPAVSYSTYCGTDVMWDANHPYGAARRKLLADLIEQTKG